MTKEIIKINGVDCSYGLTKYHFDKWNLHSSDSGTAITGKEYVNVVRKGKKKISLGWTNISTEEMVYIMDTVESGTNIEVSFALTSNKTLDYTTAYNGDISGDMKVNNGTDRLWDLSFSLIEL